MDLGSLFATYLCLYRVHKPPHHQHRLSKRYSHPIMTFRPALSSALALLWLGDELIVEYSTLVPKKASYYFANLPPRAIGEPAPSANTPAVEVGASLLHAHEAQSALISRNHPRAFHTADSVLQYAVSKLDSGKRSKIGLLCGLH